jgi:hypothetical protein
MARHAKPIGWESHDGLQIEALFEAHGMILVSDPVTGLAITYPADIWAEMADDWSEVHPLDGITWVEKSSAH